MNYAYYPGCSLHSIAKEYDASLRAVCEKTDIDLTEVRNWVCCGSSAVHVAPRRLAMALPMQNLAQVHRQQLDELMIPCALCFSRFRSAQHAVAQDPELRRELEGVVKYALTDDIHVVHPLEVFSTEEMLSRLTGQANGALSGLRVVCYYGCLLVRPPKLTGFDDSEHPQRMDRLIRALGATVLDWDARTECCGGAFSLTRMDIVTRLGRRILESALEAGADAIVTACPLCQFNLDCRQGDIGEASGTRFDLPIYYFTQLVGLALGVPSRQLMLDRHFVDARRILEQVGTA